MEKFVTKLWNQIQENLGDSLGALGLSDVQWSDLSVQVLGQLIIAMVLIGVIVGIYWIIASITDFISRRFHYGELVRRPLHIGLRYLTLIAVVLAVAAQFGAGEPILRAIARAGFMALGFYLIWLILSQVLRKVLARNRIDQSIAQLARNVMSVVLAAFAAVTVLAEFGFDILSIVAGLGIVGIAVGFAAQSTLSNFIAGITLLIERPFRIGDWVTINGQEGKVMKIALRTTWLRTRDNVFTMIPNDSVASSDIINYSAEGATRVNIPVGIAYKESAKEARQVIMPLLENHDEVMNTGTFKPRVIMTSLGDSSVNLLAQIWLRPDDLDVQPKIMADVLEKIKEALDEAGIEIPFPHLQLFVDDAKGLKPVLDPLFGPAANSDRNQPTPGASS